ncbi:THO complex subunit 2 [Hondaea fermentalgiana]|uniref:THO complex subunit 2 n=1 Tax=Hondaea fermentalgiana TaxID=2315210 RepID=A0A2R5GQ38_9STRA|nr:THO complex subunit 2 [Hondaea fermentalgiana]|eukprot:GBG32725.1 THO complex subunit 2 [Hondaea fermentalgiana]
MAETTRVYELVPMPQPGAHAGGEGARAKAQIDPAALAESCGADSERWARCWLELVWAAVDGEIAVAEVATCMKEAAQSNENSLPMAARIPEALWYVGIEVRTFESEEEKMLSPSWKRLTKLVNAVLETGIVEKQTLLEQLEFDLIGACGWGDALGPEKLKKAIVKANTNALYRQRKYNLLGEESEGFSKLVTELETLHSGNVATVLENMQRLIGYFRLDPNRVFDLILEIFEMDPENEAFVELLANFRVSNLKQLLGFKFQAYHPPATPPTDEAAVSADASVANASSSTTSQPTPTIPSAGKRPPPTPLSLYFLTAKLCALNNSKLLTLRDIMPHLHPPAQALAALTRERERRLQQSMREVGVVNLRTRTLEEVAAEEKAKKAKDAALQASVAFEDASNQKFGLVAGFIAAGFWTEALALADSLNRDAAFDHPQVLAVLFAQLRAAIDPLYSQSGIVPLGVLAAKLKSASSSENKTKKDLSNHTIGPNNHFRPVHTLDEFFEQLGPVFSVVGHRVFKDIPLLTKIIRIASVQANMPGEVPIARKRKLIHMVSHTLLPAAALLSSPNPPLMLEIWETIKNFSFAVRFDLYEIQRTDLYERIPELQMSRAKTAHEAKQVLKRVANNKDVMRLISRRLGKLSHNSPIVTLSAILNNIQAYDNLIGSMVDAIRYLSPLSFDVLAYLLVAYLGKDETAKIKDDGQSHSNWLQALCKFAGFYYAKYPQVELGGLFEYLGRQLSLKRSLDLLVLEELISRMTGLEIIENVSDETLAAMGGGEQLRGQVRASMGSSTLSIKKRPIQALRSVLEDNNLIMPLLVLIAQQQQATLFNTDDKNLKLIGHKHDKCASVLEQFIEFLAVQVPVQELADKHVLPLTDLCKKFHIEPVVAFHIVRPLLAAALHQVFFAESDSTFKKTCQDPRWLLRDEALARWKPDSEELQSMAQKQIEQRGKWKRLSPQLYTIFWSLSLYDISVPRTQYDEEMDRLKDRASGVESSQLEPTLTDKKRKAEVQRCKDAAAALKDELHLQTENRAFVLQHFDAAKASWIPCTAEPPDAPINLMAINEFLQICVLPRALFSMTDALYSARFLRLMHERSVPNCPTVFLYKKALQFVAANMVCVTEREAENLGIFMKNLLENLDAWTKDRKSFQAQFASKAGAFRKFAEPSSPKIKFEEFSQVVTRFHDNVAGICLSALSSSSYMQIRTALLITSKIGEFFPTHKSTALKLHAKAQHLIADDGRQDVVTMARRYAAFLESRIKTKKLVNDAKDPPGMITATSIAVVEAVIVIATGIATDFAIPATPATLATLATPVFLAILATLVIPATLVILAVFAIRETLATLAILATIAISETHVIVGGIVATTTAQEAMYEAKAAMPVVAAMGTGQRDLSK